MAQIQKFTAKATPQEIQKAMLGLSSLPARIAGEIDKAAYFTALDGATVDDLRQAIRAILQNALGHGFFPSPPEIRGVCDKIKQSRADYVAAQRHKEALRAQSRGFPVVNHSPETRARVAASYAGFLKSHETAKRKADAEIGLESRMAETPAEFMEKYGIDEAAFAKIPDAKTDKWRTLK